MKPNDGKFKPGKSGNPAGRPKGIKDCRVTLREKLLPHADELIEMVTNFAKSGDMAAMKIVFDRIMPPMREELIHVSIPKIESAEDCTKAQASVVNAVANGQMMPTEGKVMADLIDAQRKAFETTDIANQLRELREEITSMKGKRL